MNLGGPSESVCAKHQAGYTPDSGVIKPLSLGHLELLKNSQAKLLIETPQLTIIPCALANDGTALKPAIEFDARLKENVGLKTPVDIKYIKENPTPSPAHLKENIITEAICLITYFLRQLLFPSCGCGLLNPEWVKLARQ